MLPQTRTHMQIFAWRGWTRQPFEHQFLCTEAVTSTTTPNQVFFLFFFSVLEMVLMERVRERPVILMNRQHKFNLITVLPGDVPTGCIWPASSERGGDKTALCTLNRSSLNQRHLQPILAQILRRRPQLYTYFRSIINLKVEVGNWQVKNVSTIVGSWLLQQRKIEFRGGNKCTYWVIWVLRGEKMCFSGTGSAL